MLISVMHMFFFQIKFDFIEDETLHCIFICVGELEIVGGHGEIVTYRVP